MIRFRFRFRFRFLACAAMACALPLSALAAGTVSGRITDARDGSPVAAVTLRLGFNGVITGFMPATNVPPVVTDAEGGYVFPAVPANSGYLLRIEPPAPYLWHAWPDSPCGSVCTVLQFDALPVADGQAVIADAAIVTPGAIEGRVLRDADSQPVDGAKISAETMETVGVVTTVTSASDGRYRLSGLPPGRYRVYSEARTQNLLAEIHDDVPCIPSCDVDTEGEAVVLVESDATTAGIDFSLAAGAAIGGLVREAGLDHVPLGTGIRLSRFDGSQWALYGTRTVAAGGSAFVFGELPSGTYLLNTYYAATLGRAVYANEVFDGVDCARDACTDAEISTGTPITVVAGQVVDTVDFELERGASLSGCLRDAATGQPLAGVNVIAYRWVPPPFSSNRDMNSARSAADGCYRIDALAESDVAAMYLRTVNAAGYDDQIHDGVPCLGGNCPLGTGTPIHFGPGEHVEGFDIAMHKGAAISGSVRGLARGAPIEGARIELRNGTGIPLRVDDHYLVTGADGGFDSYGLVDGRYFLQVQITAGRFAGRHVYGAAVAPGEPVPLVTAGTPIDIEGAVGVSGIDIVLDPVTVFFDEFE